MKINDVVQVLDTIADVEYIGLLGYISAIAPNMVTVAFYTAKEKGENAFVTYLDVLPSQLYIIGQPNLFPQ